MRGAVLHHPALAHHGQEVAHLRGHAQVVRDEQHRQVQPRLDLVEQLQHLGLHRHVQRRHGLVGHQQLGVHHQRAGDAQPLALAAAELVRVTFHRTGVHAHQLQQAAGLVQRLVAPHAVVARAFDHGLGHGAPRVERAVRVLEDDLHAAAQRAQRAGGQPGDVVTAELDLTGGGVDQAHHATRHGALARAGFTHDAQRLALADLEVHVLRGVHRARLAEPALVEVGLLQPARRQHHRRAGIGCARVQAQRGHGADQHPGVVVLRALQHVVLAAHLHQVTQAQHGHAVRQLGHHAEVVRDEQHPGAVPALQLQHQLEHLLLRGDVQRGGGLVGDQQHRLEHQRHRDHDALALPARQLVRVAGHHAVGVGQQHLLDDGAHLGAALGGRQRGVLGQHLVDLVAAGHHRVQGRHRLLEDHRHARGAQFTQARQGGVRDVLALQQDAPAGHRQLLGQQPHHALRDDALAAA